MQINNRGIYCIHAKDETTEFLNDFQNLNFTAFFAVEPGDDSIENVLAAIRKMEPVSSLVFLGHGYSNGLYSPATAGYERRTYINSTVGNDLFRGHDILLLSCRSAEFIGHLKTYSSIIGFGNIPSSLEEISHEAEHSGRFRNLSKKI